LRRQAGWRRALARLRKSRAEREAAARKRFFEEAGSLTPYLAVDAAGLTFFVSTNDRLGRSLFASRRWRWPYPIERATWSWRFQLE
jgi:hypothetical protein